MNKTQPSPLNSPSTIADKLANRQNTARKKFKTLFFWEFRKENDSARLAGGGGCLGKSAEKVPFWLGLEE